MKDGDKLIEQLKAEIAETQNIYKARVNLILIMALWPHHSPALARFTTHASEGQTTREMTGNYQYGLAKFLISKQNFKAAKN